jgi:protein-L-isoaspartate(D-aspartate) O-methyltransferase
MVQRQLRGRGITNERVLQAIEEVPREMFMPSERRDEAYADHPVPIGAGQTISQPYVVALTLEELDPQPSDKVLDVGTGSGYQTALLTKLCKQVCAVEVVEELSERAAALLSRLNVDNVKFRIGDGTLGWPEEAPFDRIVCGAGGPDVPPAWVEQLAEGGRIVMPVGSEHSQTLTAIDRVQGKIRQRPICDVRFVKLIGEQGW